MTNLWACLCWTHRNLTIVRLSHRIQWITHSSHWQNWMLMWGTVWAVQRRHWQVDEDRIAVSDNRTTEQPGNEAAQQPDNRLSSFSCLCSHLISCSWPEHTRRSTWMECSPNLDYRLSLTVSSCVTGTFILNMCCTAKYELNADEWLMMNALYPQPVLYRTHTRRVVLQRSIFYR